MRRALATPRHPAPPRATPRHPAPPRATPRRAAPHCTASPCAAPPCAAPRRVHAARRAPPRNRYGMAAKLSDALMAGVHYEVFEKQKTITLNEEGARYAETALDVKDLYDPSNPWAAYVVNAIKARTMDGCMHAWGMSHPLSIVLPHAPTHRPWHVRAPILPPASNASLPPQGESPLQQGQGVCCQGRRGHDRRRVQRPHPRRQKVRRRATEAHGACNPVHPACNPTRPRWGDGLHQAMEAKEKVPIQPETEVSQARSK